MNWYLLAAAALTFVTGLIHTAIGERLVLGRMRGAGVIPTNGGTVLRERHVRIVWATWHIATVNGWCFACVLLWLALPAQAAFSGRLFFGTLIIAGMLAGSALVCIGTKARHPGWIALLASALLTSLGLLLS